MNDPRIAALIKRTKHAEWDIDDAIDWSRSPILPGWLPHKQFGMLLSQIYHGELATGRICRQLMGTIPGRQAGPFLRLQEKDEKRHASAYAHYLERIGGIRPMDEGLGRLCAAIMNWQGPWQGKVIAVHLVLETETVDLLKECSGISPCPLLGDINALVRKDEARHAAFGRLYLPPRLTELPMEDRMSIYHWIRDLWRDCAFAKRGFVALALTNRNALRRRWQRHNQTLIWIGLVTEADCLPV